MKLGISLLTLILLVGGQTHTARGPSPPRIIHVFVALCDNVNQGIVPVPARIGNGEDPKNNLYWGAAYGVKTFFAKSADWQLLLTTPSPKKAILERCVFKHRTKNVYLVADAYRGSQIKRAIKCFLKAAAGAGNQTIALNAGSENLSLRAGGAANLVAYIGHNGLMDFRLDADPKATGDSSRDAIILACISKSYFSTPLRAAGASPLLWTTGLMAPEAYVLKSALDGWILDETGEQIRTRAAAAYNQYQKCGLGAARNLLVTGW
jgi:hypothetical protein